MPFPSSPSRPRREVDRSLGLRERHKLDKLERIANASITLFGREGYDGATLRDIAREADVALGTLSLYARDKRDLVLMIFNKVVPPLIERGRRAAAPADSLVGGLVAFFTPFYRAYAEDPILYRTVLGQIYNGPGSAHAEESDAVRKDLLGDLAGIVEQAIARGECRADTDVPLQARSFFYLYFAAVRVWLFQDEPDPDRGLATLRTLYDEHSRGLFATAGRV